jgi:hypothetical protein
VSPTPLCHCEVLTWPVQYVSSAISFGKRYHHICGRHLLFICEVSHCLSTTYTTQQIRSIHRRRGLGRTWTWHRTPPYLSLPGISALAFPDPANAAPTHTASSTSIARSVLETALDIAGSYQSQARCLRNTPTFSLGHTVLLLPSCWRPCLGIAALHNRTHTTSRTSASIQHHSQFVYADVMSGMDIASRRRQHQALQ